MNLKKDITIDSVPNHIAIIMDGNGRWAKKRNKSRDYGHKEGKKSVKKIVKACAKLGIKNLTLFAFSTENWNRSPKEVNFIFDLASKVSYEESKFLNKNKVRIIHLGSIDNLPGKMIDRIKESEEMTKICSTCKKTFPKKEFFSGLKKIMNKIQI